MSLWYKFLYRVGITPWESDSDSLAPQIGSLLEREEHCREPPYGAALDLGCGTGRWTIVLARRGWDATGIDIVPRAIQAARRRAAHNTTDVRFVEGDVTRLRDADVGTDFSFFLDVECFNHLDDAERAAMGREVTAVAAPEAHLLLLAWKPARRGPLPPGADMDDLRAAFEEWEIVDSEPYGADLPAPLKKADPHWYRLARSRTAPSDVTEL